MAWQPALTGEEADRALAAARELGEILRDAAPSGDPGLATGEAGRAVALGHLDGAFPDDGFGDAAMAALGEAVRGAGAMRLDGSLMQGFTGVAWATAHLAARAGASADGATAPADAALIDVLERGRWNGGFELVSGVCGVGVYALERLPAAAGHELLRLVVATLAALSEPGDPGITWKSLPQHLHPTALERSPNGFYNLGLAHGVPGPVGVLAGAHAAGVEEAGPLLDGAVEWLAAHALPDGAASLLPYGVGEGATPAAARLAWCYGDPGAAAALLLAAGAGHEPARALAERAIERIVERPDATAGVQSASLCHGTAGLAHLCGRLHSQTGDERLPEMTRRWTAATHALRDPDAGPGGYSVWDPADPAAVAGDVQGIGLLGGIAGVALALVAAASGEDPAWDRALLLSLPPGLAA
jgi:hypothetical protein